MECDACGGTNPSIETEIVRLETYTREVVNALSQKKNKGATLDFEAWINAQNGCSHVKINCWLERVSKNFDEGFYGSEESEPDSEEDSMGRDLARHLATARCINRSSKSKEWVAGLVPLNVSYISVSKQLRDHIVACIVSGVNDNGEELWCELESHANTCVAGSNCIPLGPAGPRVNVHAFAPGYGVKMYHIQTATTVWSWMETNICWCSISASSLERI